MHSVIFLHKIIHSKINCETILASIDFHIPRVNVRNNHLLCVRNYRTHIYKCSPVYQMITNYSHTESQLDLLHCTINDIKTVYT